MPNFVMAHFAWYKFDIVIGYQSYHFYDGHNLIIVIIIMFTLIIFLSPNVILWNQFWGSFCIILSRSFLDLRSPDGPPSVILGGRASPHRLYNLKMKNWSTFLIHLHTLIISPHCCWCLVRVDEPQLKEWKVAQNYFGKFTKIERWMNDPNFHHNRHCQPPPSLWKICHQRRHRKLDWEVQSEERMWLTE